MPAWVGWRLSFEDGRWTKKPVAINTGALAETDNPSTWCDFETALRNYERLGCDGIRLCRTADLVYIDCDGVFGPDGTLLQFLWIIRILSVISGSAYLEESITGTRLHGVARGILPPGRRQFDDPNRPHTGYAFYDKSRFFTFSGAILPDNGDIHDLTKELAELHRDLFPAVSSPLNSAGSGVASAASSTFSMDDEELLDRARRARNGKNSHNSGKGTGATTRHRRKQIAPCATSSHFGPHATSVGSMTSFRDLI